MSSLAISREISADRREEGQVHGSLRKRALGLVVIALGAACSKREPSPDKPASARAVASAAAPAQAPAAAAAPPAADGEPRPEAAKADPPPPAPEPPAPPTARDDTSGPVTVTDVLDDYGFPAYTGLEHLCGGRDLLSGGDHLAWDVFVSGDPVQKITDAYARRLGRDGLQTEAGTSTWRLPAGSPAPNRTLLVLPPDRPGKHTSCKTKPAPSVATVVVVTRR